ncbi:response regulator [Brunnivagina elsteri]|uniref:Response regulatory domain-containing protein n=1 Tax=Brunnivagina elsteri CCALA 953 TaxID=987040 RepID=A0A2A2TBE3_9CYAN|nr:hypothetical protein CK510_28630 [Calothrix elsteri CCALA 953]
MPHLNGLEMVQQLRKNPELAHTTIIVSSASVFDSDRNSSLAAGANGFFPKPVETEELISQMSQYLKLHWIYEISANSTKSTDKVQLVGNKLTLLIPALQELESLHLAAKIADIDTIQQEANRIQELDVSYKPFADKLLQLVEEMNESQILKLVQQAIESNS